MPTPQAPTPVPYLLTPTALTLGVSLQAHPLSSSDQTTLIVNPTSASKTYSYLPLHGRTLAAGATLTLNGNLYSTLSTNARYQRKYQGLLNDLQAAVIKVYVNNRILVSVNAASGTTVAIGDLVYLATGSVLPAASFTWDTDLATTQAAFTNSFMGIATQAKTTTGAAKQILVDISPNSFYYLACTSEVHEVGDTLGPKKASGNALVNSTLVKSVATSSVARCVQRDSSAATHVLVNFQSAYYGANAAAQQ